VRARAGPAACDETSPAPAGTQTEPAWCGEDLTLFLPRSGLDALLAGQDAWAAAEAVAGGEAATTAQQPPGCVAAGRAGGAAADPASAGCFVLEVVDASRSRRVGGRVVGLVRIPAGDLIAPRAPGVVRGDLPLEPPPPPRHGGRTRRGAAAPGAGPRTGHLVLGRPPVAGRGLGGVEAGGRGGPPFLAVDVRWVWLDPAAAGGTAAE
jgi:hypothetical protein